MPHRPAAQDPDYVAPLRAGVDGETILDTFYNKISYTQAEGGWRFPYDPTACRGFKFEQRYARCRHRQGCDRGRAEAHRAPRRQLQEKGVKALRVGDEDLYGHYLGRGECQPEDRRDLLRGRRRDHREGAEGADRCRL